MLHSWRFWRKPMFKLPSKYASAKNSYNAGATETSHQVENTVEDQTDFGACLASYSRGQRTRQGRARLHGRRSQGKGASSRFISRKTSTTSSSRKMGKLLAWKGRPCTQGGHARGRRSIRSRQKPAAKVKVITGERETSKNIMQEVLDILVREEIGRAEKEATTRNVSSSERSGYEDDIDQDTGNPYDNPVDNNDGYQGGFSGRPENVVEESDYNVDDEIVDKMDDDGQVELDVENYIIGDLDTEEKMQN